MLSQLKISCPSKRHPIKDIHQGFSTRKRAGSRPFTLKVYTKISLTKISFTLKVYMTAVARNLLQDQCLTISDAENPCLFTPWHDDPSHCDYDGT